MNDREDKLSWVPEDEIYKVSYVLIKERHLRTFIEVFYLYHLNPQYNNTKYQSKYYLNKDPYCAKGLIDDLSELDYDEHAETMEYFMRYTQGILK